MPIITSITPQKSKKKVNIYLDYKFGFGLDLQTFLKEGLKVDQELSDKQIEQIVKTGEFQSTYDKILRFASIRPRSEKEYTDWLTKYKVHMSIKEELFNRLKRLELFDDTKFAKWWIGQRVQFKSKSKRALEQELRIKGISKETIDQVLSEEQVDELSMAKRLMTKKARLWKGLTGFEKRKKIYGLLAQNGFSGDLIRELLGEMETEFDYGGD